MHSIGFIMNYLDGLHGSKQLETRSTIDANKASKEYATDRRKNNISDEYDDFDGDHDNVTDPVEGDLRRETLMEEDANTSEDGRKLLHQSKVQTPVERKRRVQPRRDSLYAVSFRSVVYHKITAFITWPQDLQQTCSSGQEYVRPTVAGYRLRYQQLPHVGESDPEIYTTQELGDNFILLDNLEPESRYRYQIQYLFSGNASTTSAWSGEGVIDTQYSAAIKRNSAISP